MIKEKIFYVVECDKCGKKLGVDECNIFVFKTKKEAINAIIDLKGKIKGKKIYCANCKELLRGG
jgi:hypothetical protein